MFLRLFQHLLPNARAWRLTAINKQLREFFQGLANSLGDPTKTFYDEIWSDIDPQQTRELDLWEKQFGLTTSSALTEQQRRDRLDATWKAKGGQSPRYIQDTLQAAGFDVYIHEWWVPVSEPVVGVLGSATARNPLLYLNDNTGVVEYLSADGAPDMQDGDLAVAMDGATTSPDGYVLVNKIFILDPDFIGDGDLDMQDGDFDAIDGGLGSGDIIYNLKKYVIQPVPSTYAYYLYIGGVTFPDHATVPGSRRNEFETLCLKICPTQQWLGMLINYS